MFFRNTPIFSQGLVPIINKMFSQESQTIPLARLDCRHFLFEDEDETLHAYEVDLSQFQDPEGYVLLSNIFLHLSQKASKFTTRHCTCLSSML
jgi:hypothetical protein